MRACAVVIATACGRIDFAALPDAPGSCGSRVVLDEHFVGTTIDATTWTTTMSPQITVAQNDALVSAARA